MLTPVATHQLAADCRTIIRLGPLLESAKYPSAGASKDNAGTAPRSPGPRDPANLHALDLDIEATTILTGWLTNLADDLNIPHAWATNHDRNPSTLALRLAAVTTLIANREWGDDCATEIHTLATRLADYLAPPQPTNQPTPTRVLTPTAANRTVTATDASIILTQLGHPITPDLIRQWANRGHLTPAGRAPNRRRTYRLGDIADHLTRKDQPCTKPNLE